MRGFYVALPSALRGEGGNPRQVTKIICFGLGDMHLKVPDWWRIQNEALPEDQRQPETAEVQGAFVHHAIALTMASTYRPLVGRPLGDQGTAAHPRSRLLPRDKRDYQRPWV